MSNPNLIHYIWISSCYVCNDKTRLINFYPYIFNNNLPIQIISTQTLKSERLNRRLYQFKYFV